MKKICSLILTLAACLMLTVPAFAEELAPTPEVGAYGYTVTPWSGVYMRPWSANASYVVRPWESGYYTHVMPAGATYSPAAHTNYVYDVVWRSQNGSLNNFRPVKTYTSGTYKDVPAGAWYETGVRTLYERGLLGDSKNFNPRGGMTLAEVVSLAVRIHAIYNGWAIPDGMSELQYALNVGIVSADQYDDYNDAATRRSFAAILAKAVPSSALKGINAIMDGTIPDVPSDDPGAWAIYTLYRAGVLSGNNAWGTFAPNERITRDSAAVIAARLLVPSQRQNSSLVAVQPASVSMSQSVLSLNPGQTKALTAYVYPASAANQVVRWSSSNYSVASVNSQGTVTAYQPGTAVITAVTASGATAACTVTVGWY